MTKIELFLWSFSIVIVEATIFFVIVEPLLPIAFLFSDIAFVVSILNLYYVRKWYREIERINKREHHEIDRRRPIGTWQ